MLTRLLTFALNLATARSLTPEAYGVAAVQFHLINTSILFLAREGLRRGCLRVDPAAAGATGRVLGAAALAVPAGAALAALVTGALLTLGGPSHEASYRAAVAMQGAAAVVELLAEPLYILASVRQAYVVRVGVEAAATVAKSAATLGLLRAGTAPALAFSWGQLAYAAATLAGYVFYFGREWARRPKPRAGPAAGNAGRLALDRDVLRISAAFSLQAGGKLVLAEGGKAVLAAAADGAGQGVYGLVTNLGSLVVRTVFQPFEEAAFAAFSRGAGEAGPGALARRAALLALLCRAICLVGALGAAMGPAYAHLALLALYGRAWADSGAAPALGVYSALLALLAANGILEAFVHAVAGERELRRNNAALAAISVVHIALSVAGVGAAGAIGLLAADAANMALRIAYCLRFAAAHFRGAPGGFGAARLVPAPATALALLATLAVTSASRVVMLPETSLVVAALRRRQPGSPLLALAAAVEAAAPAAARAAAHVGVGLACLAAVGATAWTAEREVVDELRRMRGGGKEDEKSKKN